MRSQPFGGGRQCACGARRLWRRRELDAAHEVSDEEQVADHAAVQVAHQHVRERLAVLKDDEHNVQSYSYRTLLEIISYFKIFRTKSYYALSNTHQTGFGEAQQTGDEVVRDEVRDVLIDVHVLHVVVQVVLHIGCTMVRCVLKKRRIHATTRECSIRSPRAVWVSRSRACRG